MPTVQTKDTENGGGLKAISTRFEQAMGTVKGVIVAREILPNKSSVEEERVRATKLESVGLIGRGNCP